MSSKHVRVIAISCLIILGTFGARSCYVAHQVVPFADGVYFNHRTQELMDYRPSRAPGILKVAGGMIIYFALGKIANKKDQE